MKHTFSKKAQHAIDTIRHTRSNVFVTGKAGTGKSTLLEHIRLHSGHKKIVLLAPTGIAALNIQGETLHSFFTLKPGYEKDEAKEMEIDEQKQKKFKRLKAVAIDEISMVRADLLDAIDIVLRRARKNEQPFGGVQMIFFGDLYQLPPVVTPADRDKFESEYPSPYFFDAEVFRGSGQLFGERFSVEVIELDTIYRQQDMRFIEVLNAVRENKTNFNHFSVLNARFSPTFEPPEDENYVHLVTTNAAAKEINDKALKKLGTPRIDFYATKTGDVSPSLYPNDDLVTLSVGAQVMFVCNDQERRWVNGTIGTIADIEIKSAGEDDKNMVYERVVHVEKTDGEIVEVREHMWEISRYVYKKGVFEREIMGSFSQIPLKLAWAMTIHKSQGKTFEKVVIDLGRGSFAHGQTYVALSRCTSLEGMVLKKKIYRGSIIMDQRVTQWLDTLEHKK